MAPTSSEADLRVVDGGRDVAAVDIHPTALVDAAAHLGPGTVVGPFAVVGPHVDTGQGVRIGPHTVLEGRVVLGDDVVVHPFACVGTPPQDRSYDGEPTGVRVGARTEIREYVTINRGTEHGARWTTLGEDVLVMANSHVAHDCAVHHGVVLANGTLLAGHVTVGAHANLGGRVSVQQFSRIGELAFVAAHAGIERDVPPFCRAFGDRAQLAGINRVGLERQEVSDESIRALRNAYRALFRSRAPVAETIDRLLESGASGDLDPRVETLVRFVRSSERGICR